MTAPLIAVLDYGIGNLRSAEKALQRVGADARLTKDAGLAREASAVVLPGVGAFGACLRALRAERMEQVVFDAVDSNRPFLGICVGMQMLFSRSEEDPTARGLDVIPGSVVRLSSDVKCPQMQWNRLEVRALGDPMFTGDEFERGNTWMYFVHSYAGIPENPDDVAATCEYGGTVNAAFRRGNVFATQFHPEKSGSAGLALLENFASAARGESARP
ncbi:MAG: imidazole glycerol phosphate synthase subunit HisH [Actinomycetota bacterium]